MNLTSKNLFTYTLRCMSTKLQIPKEASLVSAAEKAVTPQANSDINPIVTNRNPRNLEKMRLARKPEGYWFEKGTNKYWHKLKIKESKGGVTAELIHNTKKIAVSASTKEWAINKYLYSSSDRSAYIILAKVFAERCFESGIHHCYSDLTPKEDTNLLYFVQTLEKEGLTLEEPTTFNIYYDWWDLPEKRPWTVLED